MNKPIPLNRGHKPRFYLHLARRGWQLDYRQDMRALAAATTRAEIDAIYERYVARDLAHIPQGVLAQCIALFALVAKKRAEVGRGVG